MIEKCNAQQEPVIVDYIGGEFYKCLYLYMNLHRYGADSETIDVYLQKEKDKIRAVYLFYYSCVHVYSRQNDFSLDEFNAFTAQKEYTMIYCEKNTAEYIWSGLPETLKKQASMTCGWVAQIEKTDREDKHQTVRAENRDFRQIISLIYEDEDIGRSYDLDDLTKQLKERAEEGYTRNCVIRDGDIVVAHACTNAEMDDLAVVAELVVNKAYRQQGYATDIWRALCSTLLAERKEVFSFYYSEESRTLHKNVGFFEVCEWAKIVIERQKG